MTPARFLTLAVFPASLVHSLGGGSPIVAPISPRIYGPNGPWYAVTHLIGNQTFDLVPGGVWEPWVIAESACQNQIEDAIGCVATVGGLYNRSASATFVGPVQEENRTLNPGVNETQALYLDTFQISHEQQSIPNAGIRVMSVANGVLPNGSQFPLPIGTVPFGAPIDYNTINSTDGQSMTESYLTSSLYANNVIPSGSISYHAGSVNLNLTASLIYGGFDQNRVIGPVITSSNQPPSKAMGPNFPLELLDIGIGTAL
ncbi:MAG: hypothetical protein Q9162_006739 [Coniocarpon cinnabarinum]